MCWFYGFALSDVMAMTLRQFNIMKNEIDNILKLQTDDEQKETSLTGDAGFNLARTILPRKR